MTSTCSHKCPFDWFFFDFGGVIAEEGFVNGLRALARAEDIDPDFMVKTGIETVFATGFVLGQGEESSFWDQVRSATGLKASDEHCRNTILEAFVLRPWMLDIIKRLRTEGRHCAILSDQVTWLDILEERHKFFHHFDQVFNSYHLGKSKRDPTLFSDVLELLGASADRALFVDDSEGNIQRAQDQGITTIFYQSREAFLDRLKTLCPLDGLLE
ncbi:MAG: HAD family hydrolase [Thermodesulfobacteriota bacterium]